MFELLASELRRNWIMFTRYPAEAIGKVLAIAILFYVLFFGTNYLAGPTAQFGQRLDAIIVGYTLWALVEFAINELTSELQTESQIGTLEQIFLSPFGTLRVLLARSLASSILNLILILFALLIILAFTGSRLYFSPVLLLPLVTTLMGAYGLAFTLGAVVLLLKRIQKLLGIFQFLLLFLFVTPFETWTGALKLLGFLLPMVPSVGMLRNLMVRGDRLDTVLFYLCLLNGIFYFTLGLFIFRLAERSAKQNGKLGGY
jgi:ABC-2 type transport system permease protein